MIRGANSVHNFRGKHVHCLKAEQGKESKEHNLRKLDLHLKFHAEIYGNDTKRTA